MRRSTRSDGLMSDEFSLTMPGGAPSLRLGGPAGCMLLHGFSSMPAELEWLAADLAQAGHTVLSVRLAGHGTQPQDLARIRWEDWLLSVEDGLALLSGCTDRVIVIGLSLGGVLALIAGARYPIAGIVGMSVPVWRTSGAHRIRLRAQRWSPSMKRKRVPLDPQLGWRREADYPAYAEFPQRILYEFARMHDTLHTALPEISAPVLLLQSNDDPFVAPDSVDQIAAALTVQDKTVVKLEHFDHALVRDPQRQVVFAYVRDFVAKLST